jgi:hypothetical protein
LPANEELAVTGGISQALIDALNQIHLAVTAQLTNPDGSPSGSAVYMHLPVGIPIDPKMYAFPWTPAGSDVYGAVQNDGQFAAPTPPPAAGTAATPATPAAALPKAPDPKMQLAMSSAYNTASKVDQMLMVTDKGIAKSWADRTVSIEYFTAITGMQAEPIPEPSADIKARIDSAQKTLYTMDADGNFTGFSPLYASYRHNEKALGDARSAFALAYSQAMADPIMGQAWPVTSSSLQTAVDQAYNDLKDMGGQKVMDAIATLQSIGGSAAAALIAKARKMYDDFSVGLLGAIAEKTPWSYIDPISWWDHNNKDFGVIQITASSDSYQAGGGGDEHSFGHSFYHDDSSSTSGSAGFNCFFYSASANAGHTDTHHQDGTNSENSGHQAFHDASAHAKVTFEWFVASIERPWFLGDLFHMDGWYLAGHKKGAISDGTLAGQIDAPDRILPMVPKGFLVVRNVSIEADDWGDAGSSFQQASDSSSSSSESSTNSYGGSVGYFGLGGSVQHNDSEASGQFTGQHDASHGWSYQSNGKGGTLTMLGSQIVGWIGQIQPLSPGKDDPNLGAATPAATTPAASTPAPTTVTLPSDTPAGTPAATPAPVN